MLQLIGNSGFLFLKYNRIKVDSKGRNCHGLLQLLSWRNHTFLWLLSWRINISWVTCLFLSKGNIMTISRSYLPRLSPLGLPRGRRPRWTPAGRCWRSPPWNVLRVTGRADCRPADCRPTDCRPADLQTADLQTADQSAPCREQRGECVCSKNGA